jgi:hypothetical protein
MGTTSSHEIDNSRSSSTLYWPFRIHEKKDLFVTLDQKLPQAKMHSLSLQDFKSLIKSEKEKTTLMFPFMVV